MDATVLQLGEKAVTMALILSAPVLLTALIIGLVIGVFQAATQIQEMTISFVPKIVAMVAVSILLGPWMIKLMVGFSRDLLLSIPDLVR